MNKIILTLVISLSANIAIAQTVPFPGLGAQFTNVNALPANLLPNNVKLIGSTTPTTNAAADAKDEEEETVENKPVATPSVQSNIATPTNALPKPAIPSQTTAAADSPINEASTPTIVEENRRLDYNHYSEKYNTNLGSKNTDMSYRIFLMNMYYQR